MNSDKTLHPNYPTTDEPIHLQKDSSPRNQHHGQVLEHVVRRAHIGISEIARKLNISRRTIYNWFETEKISIDLIRKIGNIIGHDFSIDLPDDFLADELQGIDHHFNHIPNSGAIQNDAVYYWMDRYIRLLENVNQNLLSSKGTKEEPIH